MIGKHGHCKRKIQQTNKIIYKKFGKETQPESLLTVASVLVTITFTNTTAAPLAAITVALVRVTIMMMVVVMVVMMGVVMVVMMGVVMITTLSG